MALLLALAVIVRYGALEVLGQGTTAFCEAGYSWMENSKGQSPCLVASYLLTPCSTSAASWVFPLAPGYHYNTPTDSPTSATPCRCNSVFYSAISACATCQGEQIAVVPWTLYAENCTTVYVSKYPEDIPSGTSVPAWAYIDVSKEGTFNPTAAQAVASSDALDSTALSNGPTSGTALSTTPPDATPTDVGSPEPTADGSNSSSSTKKSINIGAIVGGVVGGVVGLLAIGLTIFFALRHKRNAARNTPTGPLDLTAGEHGRYGDKPAGPDVGTEPLASPKLYDPDDPTTFPGSSDTQDPSSHDSATYPSAVQPHPSTVPYAYPTAGAFQSNIAASANPTYKGVPEL
ncbi:hypothetical protein PYCCODRAFT_1470880 [Trametes coccinea BRFM310]|uniref:Uncharacterized protein n=1 Tax=Trametes coccinea (strain BRFM310) TaxID=1353009 RepID=A0A1Y2IDJ0_TRAC3|nr:hypothetical protein PYCCODRAFT_1470880 [Trametes coccinea BRFM310]